MPMDKLTDKRCSWCQSTELYREYHDNEWGMPCYDMRSLFENLCLEGAMAGLSWITILNKRDNYRKLFANFDHLKVARFTQAKQEKLVLNAGIVRHKQKIAAFVINAQLVRDMEKNGESFAQFLWSFTNFKVVQNNFKALSDVPSKTDASEAMSKALKKRGFKFVGSTTCYAFMQASGMVNDHVTSCPSHAKVKKLAKANPVPSDWG